MNVTHDTYDAWLKEEMPLDLWQLWREARNDWVVPDHEHLETIDVVRGYGGARVLSGVCASWSEVLEAYGPERHPGPRDAWWVWRFAGPMDGRFAVRPDALVYVVEVLDGSSWRRVDVQPSREPALMGAKIECGFQSAVQEALDV